MMSIPHQKRGYFLFWYEFCGFLHKHVFSQQALCCFQVTDDPRWSGPGSWSWKKNMITCQRLCVILLVLFKPWWESHCTWKSCGLLDKGRCFLVLHWAFCPGWAGDGTPPISVASSSPSAPPAQEQQHIFFILHAKGVRQGASYFSNKHKGSGMVGTVRPSYTAHYWKPRRLKLTTPQHQLMKK